MLQKLTKVRVFHEMQQPPPCQSQEHHQLLSSSSSGGGGGGLRDLLIQCAAAVSSSDWHSTIHYLGLLSRAASPHGESTERLVCYFSAALARCASSVGGSHVRSMLRCHDLGFDFLYQHRDEGDEADEEQSAYLALNQVTPFIRFAHLSANQAILEAVDNEKNVHIVDLGIMQGLQWPPLMQALAERRRLKQLEESASASASASSSSQEDDPTSSSLTLRITGTGPSIAVLEQTGARLRDFATTLNLDFEFDAICNDHHDEDVQDMLASLQQHLQLRQGEALVVNCMTQLHRLLPTAHRAALPQALEFIKSLSPRIVTVAEKEAEHHQDQSFMERFLAALDHYAAVFDSLEATLPPRNPQRLMIERLVLSKEITGIVLEDHHRLRDEQHLIVRHQSFTNWRQVIEAAGFQLVPPSAFAIAQARLLLRLHYPADGYRLLFENEHGCLFLSWHNKPLVALSAWSC